MRTVYVSAAAVMVLGCSSDDKNTPDTGTPIMDSSIHDTAVADQSTMDTSMSDAGMDAGKTLVLSFVVVGCNRIDPKDYPADASAPASTANEAQLKRTFDEVSALNPKPKYFFAMGDIIMGYPSAAGDAGAAVMDAELTAWLAFYNASSLASSGIKLIPLPGNHEMQSKQGNNKYAFPEAEATWLAHMKSFIPQGYKKGPMAGAPVVGDGGFEGGTITTDQSDLTYSFDDGTTHFVVLDTDPVGADWNVPAPWIAQDIAAAKNGGAKHVFAIGHKPAYPLNPPGTDGLTQGVSRDAFWSTLEGSQSEAMIAAHNHVWWWKQPNSGKTFQIVAGNGGSKLEDNILNPPDSGPIPESGKYYGFTVVSVWSDDTVTLDSYGRDIPAGNYFDPAPSNTNPTTVRKSLKITWGTTMQ
jgi:hypothetical protein